MAKVETEAQKQLSWDGLPAVALEQSQLSFLCLPLNRDRVLKVMGKLKGERQSTLKEIQVSKRGTGAKKEGCSQRQCETKPGGVSAQRHVRSLHLFPQEASLQTQSHFYRMVWLTLSPVLQGYALPWATTSFDWEAAFLASASSCHNR